MAELIATDTYDVIVGFGTTGQSVARYLKARGIKFGICDTRENDDIRRTVEKNFAGHKLLQGALSEEYLLGANRIVISPGVSRKEPAIKKAIEHGVAVVGDIELFLQETKIPVIGITGSNGKTTVTTLVANVLRRAGKKVAVGGNIGTPALELLALDAEVCVLELSSFQLESVTNPKLQAACVLNVTPDHMDRYGSLQEYCMSKQKIYWGAKSVVFNRDDVLTVSPEVNDVPRYSFGAKSSEDLSSKNYWFNQSDGWIYYQRKPLLQRNNIKMVGDHNVLNAMAVLGLAEAFGVNAETVKEELESFAGLPHRCQWVDKKRGVTFINDSKGTNVGASIAAIEGLKQQFQRLVLIAGGEGKNADFGELGKVIEKNVHEIIVMGKDGRAIADSLFTKKNGVYFSNSMKEAVRKAFSLAESGDAVLLSPACASLDMFASYEDRGNIFTQAVAEL